MALLRKYVFIGAFVALGHSGASPAADLLDDYGRARISDPTFAVAVGDFEVTQIQARLAGAAYYPEMKVSVAQYDSEVGTRATVSLTQPVFSTDRWLSLQESDPRFVIAAANYLKSQHELALRLFKTISALVSARERLSFSQTNITALEAQANSAKRSYKLGLGTVTDVLDTEVRLAQVRTQALSLRVAVEVAERQYAAMIGEMPKAGNYRLAAQSVPLQLLALPEFLDQANQLNPSIRASEQSSLIGEISRKRAKAIYLPSVVFSAQRTEYEDARSSSSGVVLRVDIPIQASSFYKIQTATVEAQKLKDHERDVKQKVNLDVERLFSQLEASRDEVAIRREAIRAAQLGVDATEQSFKGGVRSKIDVLNSLQTLFQVKSDYVTALLLLGEHLLNLQLSSAVEVDLALKQVQEQLFTH